MTAKTEIYHLMNIVAAPTEVGEDINVSPRWRVPLLFMMLSSVVIGWFMIPAIMEPMRKIFISSFGEGAAESAMKNVMKSMLIMQLIIEPLFSFFRWLIFAGILYVFSFAFVEVRPYLLGKIFSLVAYSEAIFVLMNILTVFIIYIKGINSIEAIGDITVVRGLDFFITDKSNTSLVTILGNINPFSVWYIVTITFGFSMLTKLRKSRSLIIVSISWIIWAAVSAVHSRVAAQLVAVFMGQT